MKVLVTGGTGYIGSHTCVELIKNGYEVIVVDNLFNSSRESLNRIKKITGKTIKFHKTDLLDRTDLESIFLENKIDAVLHFAGLKAVGESSVIPLRYYHNNLTGSIILCETMQKFGVKKIVFSSSATVYGLPQTLPISENFRLSAVNPYGRTKLMIEEMLQDLYQSDKEWAIAILRYFNPFGAHPSGLIGEDPNGIPNNLMPYVSQVAAGKLKELKVFGNDYPTPDGTGIRDYIHVVDLAEGHIKALKKVNSEAGIEAYNLGTGTGYSVLEMVAAFEKVSNVSIPYRFTDRRPGDIASCYADPSKAMNELGWTATRGLVEMCADSWRWQKNNLNGYHTKNGTT
jgi:UDP-glucose 4-epimerase